MTDNPKLRQMGLSLEMQLAQREQLRERIAELPRWVDIAIAEHLLGLRVERRDPPTSPTGRPYGREVTFFYEPESKGGLVRWSYDNNGCNFMPWRNGRDASDGVAEPLPHFVSGLFDTSHLFELMDLLREQAIYIEIASTGFTNGRPWIAKAWDFDVECPVALGGEPQQAVGWALLQLIEYRQSIGKLPADLKLGDV